ncbi:polyprenyl synthetase family protein [Nocardia sp. NPDC004750]
MRSDILNTFASEVCADGVQMLERTRAQIEPLLREAVASLPEPLCLMAGYHFGWWDATGGPVAGASGKSLRAALLIAAANAFGGAGVSALRAAVAIELVHNFSLVHDDIIDGDSTRRGRPSAWAVWGVNEAVLLGNALHALAIRELAAALPISAAAAATERLETAVLQMCAGQHQDCAFETHPGIHIDDYIQMARGKTGALIGCACAVGALCAGADAHMVSVMDSFGRDLGLAFQFTDDVIGIWGDPQVTGKPVGSDLARRKQTLPVIKVLTSGTDAANKLRALYESKVVLTPAEVDQARGLLDLTDTRSWTEQCASQRARAAIRALPDRWATSDLLTLARSAVCRDR